MTIHDDLWQFMTIHDNLWECINPRLRHNQDAQLTRIIVIAIVTRKACATCATESATVRLQTARSFAHVQYGVILYEN